MSTNHLHNNAVNRSESLRGARLDGSGAILWRDAGDRTAPMVHTVKEAAAVLKVSEKSVYRLVARGLLQASKGLRHLRITHASIVKLLGD